MDETTHLRIELSDGTYVLIAWSVIAREPKWRELLKDLYRAKWEAYARRKTINA